MVAKNTLPLTPPRSVRLRSAFDLQRALARLYNDVLRGRIDPVVAGRCAYVASVMLKAREAGELEERLRKLEAVAYAEKST